jgi:phospholipid/cholesterol/gamma-HCH transport system permease protein
MSSVARFTDSVEEGRRVLRFQGDLTLPRLGVLPNRLDRLKGNDFLIDLSGVGRIDTIGAWLVHRTARERGGEIVNADPSVSSLIRQVEKADQPVKVRPDPPPPFQRVLDQLGTATVEAGRTPTSSAIRAGSGSTRSFSASKWSGSMPSGSSD